jgi:hypothetical protein
MLRVLTGGPSTVSGSGVPSPPVTVTVVACAAAGTRRGGEGSDADHAGHAEGGAGADQFEVVIG